MTAASSGDWTMHGGGAKPEPAIPPSPWRSAAIAIQAPVRIATEMDASEVARLLRQLGCVRWNGDEADMTRSVAAFLARPGSTRVLVVGDANRLDAAAVVHAFPAPAQNGIQLFLDDLIVDDAARGRGLGKTMMAGVVAARDAMGAVLVYGRVDPGNAAADGLYRAHGLSPAADTLYQWDAPDGPPASGGRLG